MELKLFYESEIDKFKEKLVKIKKKLLLTSMSRLVIFFVTFISMYQFWEHTQIIIFSLVLGIALFLIVIKIHLKFVEFKKYIQARILLNENEIKALNGDFSVRQQTDGKIYEIEAHYFSHDIDLFGQNSFFQHVNRTFLKESEEKLAAKILSNDCEDIEEKQKTVQEISEKIEFRHHFSTIASLVSSDIASSIIIDNIKKYKPFVSKFIHVLTLVFPFLSAAVFLLYGINMIPESYLIYHLILGLLVSGLFLKKVSKLSSFASQTSNVLSNYSKLLFEIEKEDFKSKTLIAIKKSIEKENLVASKNLKYFSKYLDALDQRNNIIFIIFANGFLLWDLRQSYKIEKWIEQNKTVVENWFDVIFEMESTISMANFNYNHPDFVFPIIDNSNEIVIKANHLGHFMIHKNKRVNNDVLINKDNFIIITGANMAGKSTFLRTIGLSILSANLGLPVCAKTFNYSPIKLISSMRTSDSLLDDESYFFSELKRLKFIIEEIKKDKYFIILDEILKGTNSKDKEEGSKKFVKKLIELKSTGIIATHDLGLCTLSDEYTQIQNKYFDAEIIDDELHFDYTMKEGVCKNMNASFLLKKMEII